MTNHNDEADTITIRISCNVCAKEFGSTCALDLYEAVVAGAEEACEGVVLPATCPECKAKTTDPFLQLMNKVRARMNERS